MAPAKQVAKSRKKTVSSNGKMRLRNLALNKAQVIKDYRLAFMSRQASLLGRREVMGGKAKFGIFGDGKEVAQIAMAKAFKPGDFRSGYYRDQTFMFATGMSNISEFFAQLYADADVEREPATAGRAMNNHFATRSLNPDGSWKALTKMFNSASDISPTGSQMPRLVGLAYASRLYRELEELKPFNQFSENGNEVAFGTIGNATCSEGMFWESVNAIGVLKSPAVISIWDDEYGISVSNEQQITKQNLSAVLAGFQRETPDGQGYELFRVKGWDYPELVKTYLRAAELARAEHVPSIIHVVELTQPQGHSTSGSHERYKSKKRLEWEAEFDCVKKMREWLLASGIATKEQLDKFEAEDAREVISLRDRAWEAFQKPIIEERTQVISLLQDLASGSSHAAELQQIVGRLRGAANPVRRNIAPAVHDALIVCRDDPSPAKESLADWKKDYEAQNRERFGSHLYSESQNTALSAPAISPKFSETSPKVNGFEILTACFSAAFEREPRLFAFGEDVGFLGGVNQGFRGLQSKFGELRISDTGIRECTILGQAIGMALRGLRPIAEIQYLDYVLYALQIMSDDLATLRWRTRGGQKAPVIVRTRGHRLEGIWHAGSPMAAMVHLLRGMYVLVPRNMTQAAGFYNTLLKSDDSAVIVEVLNGYRLKETLPDNIGEFAVPLGVPEVLREGSDVTLVTYGALCRIALEAAQQLERVGVGVEVIDVQTLLPFDIHGRILESLKKTNRIVFVDEDVPGGATAYMMREVLETQCGYQWLDSEPRTITGAAHRPAYGSDGDYFSKPNVEQIFAAVYDLMREANPDSYPALY